MADHVDPDEYVREHREKLRYVIQHSEDPFTRALAITVTTKYGDDPDIEQILAEIEAAEEGVD